VPRTRASVAEMARQEASKETEEIQAAYAAYLAGKKGPWLVAASSLTDRLDAKFLLPWSVAQFEPAWEEAGLESVALEELVEPVEEPVTLRPNDTYRFLRITYAGRAEEGEALLGKEVTYSSVGVAKAGDIVVSNISAVYKAVCVLPDGCEHLLVSSEFTVLRPKPGAKVDPFYLWSVLRTDAVIAEWISHSTGVGRHRVGWELMRAQRIPLLADPEQRRVGKLLREVLQQERDMRVKEESAYAALAPLQLDGDEARDRLARAKPPR
jgi:type I restriction enzyme M protein